MNQRKAQTWSTDAIIAVAIFMLVLMSFFYITSRSSTEKNIDVYADEAAKIPDLFAKSQNTSIRFIDGNKVVPEKLDDLASLDYDQVKFLLGIKNDFCIHFEDDAGNVIFINSTTNVTGIGSPRATVSNKTCS